MDSKIQSVMNLAGLLSLILTALNSNKNTFVIGIVITFISFIFINLYFWIINKKFYSFFGIKKDNLFSIILPSFWNKIEFDQNLKEENYRYYKNVENNSKKQLIGPTTFPVTGVGAVSIACKLSNLIGKEFKKDINVFGDEMLGNHSSGPVISLGSPTSNNITEKLLKNLPENIKIEFSTETMRCWIHPESYRASVDLDYAILVRTFDNERVHFICAGIDEEGTIAVCQHLINEWKRLPNKIFINVYEVEKRSLQVKKLGSIHMSNSEWKAL